jgi:hypothetical protein
MLLAATTEQVDWMQRLGEEIKVISDKHITERHS